MDLGKLTELSHHRKCVECGAEFETREASKGEQEVAALAQFCDHIASHQPTLGEWTEAYNRIRSGLASARGRM